MVALDRALCAGDLLGERGALFGERRPVSFAAGGGLLDRIADHAAVAVEAGELVQDRGLQLVLRQSLAIAASPSELLSPGAGVVAVGAAVAFGGHSDVGAAAAPAADKPCEQEVCAAGGAHSQVLAALLQQCLCGVEGVLVDQWVVDAGERLLAPVNPPDIRLVAENPENDCWLPAARRRWRLFAIEPACDCRGAEPSGGVPLEDAAYDGGGAIVGDKFLAVVAGVSEGDAAVRPAAFPRAALDAAGHAVNDGGVLELSEHPEHLKHHPPGRASGVEWLCRGA
ncbi:MAG TPA: hypothetical protein VNY27_12495 [Solirubrobacteraceae bacterium]|nr:hypothetical protein [Solirubrobacteraceae bacterium]